MANARRQMFAGKKLREQYASQLEAERNGAPIPGDIAELMTKPKVVQPLYQVKADVRDQYGVARPLPIGPKIGLDACEEILIAVNGQISLGKLPGWSNARLEAVHTSQGA